MRSRHLYSAFVMCLLVQCVSGGSAKNAFMTAGSFAHNLFECGMGGCDGNNPDTNRGCQFKGQYYSGGRQNTNGSIIESECEQCPAGTFASEFSRKSEEETCKNCAAGRHSKPTLPFDICLECEINTFNKDERRASCEHCPPGKWTKNEKGQESCESCVKEGDPPPLKCGAGKKLKNGCCLPCEKGFYKIGLNAEVSRTICPKDTVVPFWPEDEQCPYCMHGRYSYPTGERPKGKKITDPPKPCKKCIAGKYADDAGSTSCASCEMGFFSGADAWNCTQCPVGTYSAHSQGIELNPLQKAGVKCVDCPAGKMNTWVNEYEYRGCFPCAMGLFKNSSGRHACQKCPIGTYSDNPELSRAQRRSYLMGATGCTRCPGGWTNGMEGMAVCDICQAGTFSATGGKTDVCPQCDGDTYCKSNDYNDLPYAWHTHSRRAKGTEEQLLDIYSQSMEAMKDIREVMLQTGQPTGCTRCEPCDTKIWGLKQGWVTDDRNDCVRCADHWMPWNIHTPDGHWIILGGIMTPYFCEVWLVVWIVVIALVSCGIIYYFKYYKESIERDVPADPTQESISENLTQELNLQPSQEAVNSDSEQAALKMFEF